MTDVASTLIAVPPQVASVRRVADIEYMIPPLVTSSVVQGQVEPWDQYQRPPANTPTFVPDNENRRAFQLLDLNEDSFPGWDLYQTAPDGTRPHVDDPEVNRAFKLLEECPPETHPWDLYRTTPSVLKPFVRPGKERRAFQLLEFYCPVEAGPLVFSVVAARRIADIEYSIPDEVSTVLILVPSKVSSARRIADIEYNIPDEVSTVLILVPSTVSSARRIADIE